MGPFVYEPRRSLEVLTHTDEFLNKNKELDDEINRYSWIYHSLGDLIPQTTQNFWSGHFFPFSESWNEIQIAYTLSKFGLYKQAMASLRIGYELGLLSVYYNINDQGHKTVQNWLASNDNKEADTPRFREIWKILMANKNIEEFQKSFDLKSRLLSLGYLHNYVHSKGAKFSNSIGLLKSNFQTFEIEGLKHWIDSFKEITKLICTLHLLKYPVGLVKFDYGKKFGIDVPMFSHLRPFQVRDIESILPKEWVTKLNEISNNDQFTQDFINEIQAKPDLTDEQIESQIIESEKNWITKKGSNLWLEEQLKMYKVNSIEELIEPIKIRTQKLFDWGIENGYEKPIWDQTKK